MPLVEYEETKVGTRYRSRYMDQGVPRLVRERWLLAVGHSRNELLAAEGRARRAKMRRIRSAKTFESDGLELFSSLLALRRTTKTPSNYSSDEGSSDEGWL